MPPVATAPQNGHIIRALRVRQGMTVNELAERVGISPHHVRNVELEHKNISLLRLRMIAAALGVPLTVITR